MPLIEIDIRFFHKTKTLDSSDCSHEITEGTLPYSDGNWICKTVRESRDARYELLGQEFYRLMIPGQPRTLIAKQANGSAYYILSEKIADFQALPINHQVRFTQGNYTGLGMILIISIFLHEIDLNPGNLGLNVLNQVRKIDGDWGLAALLKPELFRGISTDITPEIIQNLPFINNYFVYNWLDIIYQKKNLSRSSIVDPDLSSSPHFRAEINQAILSILLLPPHYMQQFIQSYMLGETKFLLATFLARQEELRHSAMQNKSFVDYLTSPDAPEMAKNQLIHLKNFAAHTWFPIIPPTEHQQLELDHDSLWSSIVPRPERLAPSPSSVVAYPHAEDVAVSTQQTQQESALESSSHMPSATYNSNRMFKAPPQATLNKPLRANRTCSDLSQYLEMG